MLQRPTQLIDDKAINLHVARRLKASRMAVGISQETASSHLGVTFQQLQKYESGKNRIVAGRLAILAQLYGTRVEWYFDEAPGLSLHVETRPISAINDLAGDFLCLPHADDLARDFIAISDKSARLSIVKIAATIAASHRNGLLVPVQNQ